MDVEGDDIDSTNADEPAKVTDRDLAELAGQLNLVNARLVAVTEHLLTTDAWQQGGMRSPKAFLAWRFGLSPERAEQIVTIARHRHEFPTVIDLFDHGQLSIEQVHEAVQVPAWADTDIAHLATISTVTKLRRAKRSDNFTGDPDEPHPTPAPPQDRLRFGTGRNGRWHITGELGIDDGRRIEAALTERKDAIFTNGDEHVTWPEAFIDCFDRSLASVDSPSRRDHYRTWLHLDITNNELTTTDGWRLPDTIADRLLCDGIVQPVWESDGVPFSLGRTQRVVPERTRRIIERRDRGCRVPGCDSHHVEIHHIRHWLDGGTTDTANLISLCPRHHKLHHHGQLGITGNADQFDDIVFTIPTASEDSGSGNRPATSPNSRHQTSPTRRPSTAASTGTGSDSAGSTPTPSNNNANKHSTHSTNAEPPDRTRCPCRVATFAGARGREGRRMGPPRSILAGFVVAASFTGCSISDDDTSDGSAEPDSNEPTASVPSDTEPADPTTVPSSTVAPTSTTPPVASTTAPPATTTTPTTTNASPTTTSQPGSTTTVAGADGPTADRVSVSVDIPTGEFVAAPGDLIVVRADGDLEYHPNALSPGNEAPIITLLDRDDPQTQPAEGPGPNVISDVAGFVNGSVIYGECCEPVSGNVFAVDAPGSEAGPLAVGSIVDQSPDGSKLATASYLQLNIVDIESGEGNGLVLTQASGGPTEFVDVEWATDDTLLAIVSDGEDRRVLVYDAETLTAAPIELNLDPTVDLDGARFVGRSPDGQVAVATTTGSGSWDVLYLDPNTLEMDDQMHQKFPLSVSNLEIDADGLGQIWVDGGTLYYLGPGQLEARPIGDQVAAAWFAE